jgi:hypothetical protein
MFELVEGVRTGYWWVAALGICSLRARLDTGRPERYYRCLADLPEIR